MLEKYKLKINMIQIEKILLKTHYWICMLFIGSFLVSMVSFVILLILAFIARFW